MSGPNDLDGLEDRWKSPIQLDEEEAITVCELHATAHLALQHDQLPPERGILCFKSALGPKERRDQVQEEDYQRDPRRQREAILSADQYGRDFRNTQVIVAPGSPKHDHSRPECQLCVSNAALAVLDDEVAFESKRFAQPLDHPRGIAIPQARYDRACHDRRRAARPPEI